MCKPPDRHQSHQADCDHTRVIHSLRRHRQDEREAEEDDGHEDVDQAGDIDEEAERAAHVERSGDDVLPAGEDVREDCAGVGERGEDDVGGYEGLEGSCAADVDAADAGDHCAHGDCGSCR